MAVTLRQRLRVLIFIKGLGLGGAERLLERAIPYLSRDEFDYQIAYLLPWKRALVAPFQDAGIPVHCLNLRRLADVSVLSRLIGLLRREQIDLIHVHLPLSGVLARLARRPGRVRWVVYTEHGVPSHYRVISRTLNAATYRMNDAVIAVSAEVASRIRHYVRNGRPRLVTIPNAIDPAIFNDQRIDRSRICREFSLPIDARLVVTVGNLRGAKGHRHLLAAARRLIAEEPRTRVLIVGLGPLEIPLKEEARRLGLNGRVVFTGFRADATSLIAAADVYVLPSLFEGLPISLLEAMALGRPVIATRVGGVPEVVASGETGILVPPGDADRLASEILSLLRDPTRSRRLGESARAAVTQRFSVRQMVDATEDVYRTLATETTAAYPA